MQIIESIRLTSYGSDSSLRRARRVTECACAVQTDDAASAESGIATVTVLLRSDFFFFLHFPPKICPKDQPHRYRHGKSVSLQDIYVYIYIHTPHVN